MEIAYLGDEYSFSYLAARRFGGDKLAAYPTIRAALAAVQAGEREACAVPIENSIEGSVHDCLDALTQYPLYICAETVLTVRQLLIGLPGTDAGAVKTVYSHPQALSQCKGYLDAHGMRGVAVGSTSEGLTRVTSTTEGAIARAARPGQIVLDENIADYPNNATRFVLIRRAPQFTGGKVSVTFETRNEPGALLTALAVLAGFGLNMVRIESRPHKSAMGRYIFFVDFMFGKSKDELMKILDALSAKTGFLKFLGKYDTVTEAT